MHDDSRFVRGQRRLMKQAQEEAQWRLEDAEDRARIRKAYNRAVKQARKTKDKYGHDHNV